MGLAEVAERLMKEANDPGYQFLRELRKMGEMYSWDAVSARWDAIAEFENTAEGVTLEGQGKLCRMIAEANEMDELGKYCRRLVKKAEELERREKGSASREAQLHMVQIKATIAAIREKWRVQKELQITLEDIGKDGAADGCDDQGN